MTKDSDQDSPTEKLSDMMKRAAAGNLMDAHEVVQHLASIVSPTNTCRDWSSDDPNKRIVEPVPDFVREYLSRALEQIVSGVDARDAFHLRKRRGTQQFWTHRDKSLAV